MPYAVPCPKCGLVIVLEALGPFACPLCDKTPVPVPAPEPPPGAEVVEYGVLLPPEPEDDGYFEEVDTRRARRERERTARRKLLLKLAAVLVLAVVTVFAVRAAVAHVEAVAEQNAAPAH